MKARPQSFYYVAKRLIGEVFQEERRPTQTYEAILLSVAEGMWNTTLISSRLSMEPQKVSSYLSTLEKMDLVRRIRAYKGGKGIEWYYDVVSPVLSVVLYAEAKYRVSEGYGKSEAGLDYPVYRELQFSIGKMLAEYHGAELAYTPKET